MLVFLFNVIGYRVYFYFLEQAADTRIEAKLQALSEFDDQLITVKIPINLPYHTDWKDFERTEGEVTVRGRVLRYVKQKVSRDTLSLLCIDDNEKSALKKQSSDYFKKVNDLNAESSKKSGLKQPKLDYIEEIPFSAPIIYSTLLADYNHIDDARNFPGHVRTVKMPPRQMVVLS